MTKFFYKDANVEILVYDISSKSSLDSLTNYWYKEVKEHGPENIVLSVAGNKSDLYELEEIEENQVREFAQSIDTIFALISPRNNSN